MSVVNLYDVYDKEKNNEKVLERARVARITELIGKRVNVADYEKKNKRIMGRYKVVTVGTKLVLPSTNIQMELWQEWDKVTSKLLKHYGKAGV